MALKSADEYTDLLKALAEEKKVKDSGIDLLISLSLKNFRNDADALEFFFQYVSDVDYSSGQNSKVTELFIWLLHHNADISWFQSASLLSDGRNDYEVYAEVIRRCFLDGLSPDLIDSFEKNSSNSSEFRFLADKEIARRHPEGTPPVSSGEQNEEDSSVSEPLEAFSLLKDSTDHINRLITMNNELENENNRLHDKQYSLLKAAFASDSRASLLKEKADRLEQEKKDEHIGRLIAEKKLSVYVDLSARLDRINHDLLSSGDSSLKPELEEAKASLARAEDSLSKKEAELSERDEELKNLRGECADLRSQLSALQNAISLKDAAALRKPDPVTAGENVPAFPDVPDDVAPSDSISELDFVSPESEEPEEQKDFEDSELVSLNRIKDAVKSRVGMFLSKFSGHFSSKFDKLGQGEKEAQIYIKLCEGSYSDRVSAAVKKWLRENRGASCSELYRLVSSRADEDSVCEYCNAA